MNIVQSPRSHSADDDPPILVEGKTCWRRVLANRVAFLVDGEAYYSALDDALERARHQVLLVGWDFHSRVRLRPGEDAGRDELASRLDHIARRRRGLRCYVLGWDYAMLYSLERELLPRRQFGTKTHRRVRFELDSEHPTGASHHQKVVVIDDDVAFAGGFDVTTHRWDTRDHSPGDPRRVTPEGRPYQPFHDVQVAVSGEAAAALGTLARERWHRATGRRLQPPHQAGSAWPESLTPEVTGARVGIARTLPPYGGQPEIREVEALYLASVAAARHSIYIENQYLTSHRVTSALAARLAESGGPDVVIVAPRSCTGWLEKNVMGALRSRVMERLREADHEGRLRLLYPHVPGLPENEHVIVHAKVMIVDDRMARIGSSNLSNRSMGLDTECDLALEANGDPDAERAVAGLRCDLLAEHLAVRPEDVARAHRSSGSLARAVDALQREEGRSLRRLDDRETDAWTAEFASTLAALDPERPLGVGALIASGEDEDREDTESRHRRRRRRSWIALATGGAVLGGLALAWRFGPLAEWARPEALGALAAPLRSGVGGAALAALVFAGLALLMFPVLALIVTTALVFEPWRAFSVSLAGTLLSAVAGHAIGRLLWRDAVLRIAGSRLRELSHRLSRRGVLATAAVRLVPVAPYNLVNLVAGASHVRLRDFALGTMLAMTPGIAMLTLAAEGVMRAVRDPSPTAWAWAAVALCATGALLTALRRLARRTDDA